MRKAAHFRREQLQTGQNDTKAAYRNEAEVFEDIAALCASEGYIHAIAYFCFRDNIIRFGENLTTKDMDHHYEGSGLIRSEISTLIGLMARSPIGLQLPDPQIMQIYVDRTDSLMSELHHAIAMNAFLGGKDWAALLEEGRDPFDDGAAMREPIFYGGEAAYDFQYEAITALKYSSDDQWLADSRGFSIADALAVTKAIGEGHISKLASIRKEMRARNPSEWTFLPAFMFTVKEVADRSGLEIATINAVLRAFQFEEHERNAPFTGISEFNETNARPILCLADGSYVLLQHYQLQESLYESPFFWMMADDKYRSTATAHRGDFTEAYTSDRLRSAFGEARVLRNIDIYRGKNRYAEADALVLFGNHAIVVQAKSKRLTLEARKGNDRALRDDFKKAVENAYDQALFCAEALQNPSAFTFQDTTRVEVKIQNSISVIFPVCVLADHYPALSFQSRQFLRVRATASVKPPLVTDVFTLDVIAEFLDSPLQFLNYLDLRAQAYDKLLITNELVPFSYHLRNNLWLDPKYDMVNLGEDFTAHVDVAMAVRRQGVSGNPEVKGVLTRYRGTRTGAILDQIQQATIPELTELGLWILQLSGAAADGLSRALESQIQAAVRDRATKDLTFPFEGQSAGFTIHLSALPDEVAREKILQHCQLKKYDLKADRWYGLILYPDDLQIRHAIVLVSPWKQDHAMDKILAALPRRAPVLLETMRRTPKKVGRNEPCLCGSGLKYKKCCLPR
jgi:hypothetical protein